MLKKNKRGQLGLTLENIEKLLIHFASHRPRKPLNCLKKLSPSLKTIEVFGKPPPVPFPCDRGREREGDPFIQCPLPSSLQFELFETFSYQRKIIYSSVHCTSFVCSLGEPEIHVQGFRLSGTIRFTGFNISSM